VCFRLLWNVAYVALIYYTPALLARNDKHVSTYYYYSILVFVKTVHEVSRRTNVSRFISIQTNNTRADLFCR